MNPCPLLWMSILNMSNRRLLKNKKEGREEGRKEGYN